MMGAHASQSPHHAQLTLTTLGTLFSTFVTPWEKKIQPQKTDLLGKHTCRQEKIVLGHGESQMNLEHTDTGKSKKRNSSSTG